MPKRLNTPSTSPKGTPSASRLAPDGAHAVRNDTAEMVRVLMFSNRSDPGASVCPDSGKVGVWTGNTDDDLIVERSSGVGYRHGEAPGA